MRFRKTDGIILNAISLRGAALTGGFVLGGNYHLVNLFPVNIDDLQVDYFR